MTFKNASLAIFVLLLTFYANVFAQQDSAKTRYLQVSTNPSTVDLYTGTISPGCEAESRTLRRSFPSPQGKTPSWFHFSTRIMPTRPSTLR